MLCVVMRVVFNLIDELTYIWSWLVVQMSFYYIMSVSVYVESTTTTLLLKAVAVGPIVTFDIQITYRRRYDQSEKSLYFPSFIYYVLQVLSSVLIVSRGLLLSFLKCERVGWIHQTRSELQSKDQMIALTISNTRLKKEQNSISSHNLKSSNRILLIANFSFVTTTIRLVRNA